MFEELEFARPVLLWLLLLLPVVYVIHLERSGRMLTDRLDIWQRAIRRVPRARRRFMNLRLLLELLVTTGVVLALAGPRRPERPGYERVWCVVDRSPSMATLDADGGARLGAAFAKLQSWLDRVPEWIPFEIRGLTGAVLRKEYELEPGAERKPLELGAELQGHARLDATVELAGIGGPKTLVVVAADGAGPSTWPQMPPEHMRFEVVGSADTDNAAILAAELEDPWPGPMLTLAITVRAQTGELVVTKSDDTEVSRTPLQPGTSKYTVQVPRGSGTPVRVTLAPSDAYARDDALRVLPRAPWAPAILTVPQVQDHGVLAAFLAEALSGTVVTGEQEAADRDRLVLRDGGRLSEWPTDGAVRVLFGTELPRMSGDREVDQYPDWDRSHPLLRGLDLATVRAQRMRTATGRLPDGVEVLARIANRPFVIVSKRHRLLWFATKLSDSNLRLQPFLPILCLRSLGQLAPGQGESRLVADLDPPESEIAAKPARGVKTDPVFWRPELAYWPWVLAFAAALLAVRACLSVF